MTRSLLAILTLMIVILSCRQKDKEATTVDIVDPVEILNYQSGDTLRLSALTPGLKEWISFYSQLDTSFRLSRFRASGVSLHMQELPDAIVKGNEASFRDMFVYSPDSSRYLDLVSYNYMRNNRDLTPGEADQQVVLADVRKQLKKQLMYNGPSQLAEFADWTGPDSFIIGVTSRAESGNQVNAEIMFFHLKDSSFTNFTLDHGIPLDTLVASQKNFLDHFFTNRQFNVK